VSDWIWVVAGYGVAGVTWASYVVWVLRGNRGSGR
jgi:hypothetical protein